MPGAEGARDHEALAAAAVPVRGGAFRGRHRDRPRRERGLPPGVLATAGAPDADGRIWFEVLGVSQEAGRYEEIALATGADELSAARAEYRFDGPSPAVSFEEHIVDDGCGAPSQVT